METQSLSSLFDKMIYELDLISKLQIGDKLCVKNDELSIDKASRTQFLYRWFNQSNRDRSLLYLSDMINRLSNLVEIIIEGKIVSEMKITSNAMRNILEGSIICAMDGICVLKHSYSDDIQHITRLDTIIRNLRFNYSRVKLEAK